MQIVRRAPRRVGGDRPARLRRRRLQRAPHLAVRAHELAEPPRRLRRPAHAPDQAPDLRQPPAAPRSAPAGRGAGHARLPLERPHRLGLRARHPARVQRLQGAAVRVARPLRGGVGDHPPGVDRGGLLLRGPVLVVSRRGDLAAAGAAAASAGVGAGIRQQGDDRVGRAPTTSRSRRGWCRRAGCARTSSATTRAASSGTATALTPDHLVIQASAYVADSKAQAVKEAGPYTLYFNRTLFSHGNVSEASRQREAGYLSSALVRLRAAREPRRGVRRARAIPRHDDGGHRARGRADGVGHAGEVIERIIARRRARRRRHRARQHEPRRDAPRDVHGADPPLRRRGAAGAAGAPGERRMPTAAAGRLSPPTRSSGSARSPRRP